MVQTIDGHVPNYVDPPTRVPEFLGVQIGMTVVALVVVCLRLWTRKYLRNIFSVEDWVAAAGMFLGALATTLSCLGVLGGTGLHYYDVPLDTNTSLAATFSFANQVLYQPILNLTKSSILLFYISVLGRNVRRPCYYLITVAILFCIACTVVEFVQCTPTSMLWKGTRPDGYRCINQPHFFQATGVINLILDLAILVVPLPVVWKLQAPRRTKIALSLIFSVGLLSMGSEIARLVIWFQTSDGNRTNPDATWNRISIVDWSCIEYTTGIICASLPHLKALITSLSPNFFESIIRSSHGLSGNKRSGHGKAGYGGGLGKAYGGLSGSGIKLNSHDPENPFDDARKGHQSGNGVMYPKPVIAVGGRNSDAQIGIAISKSGSGSGSATSRHEKNVGGDGESEEYMLETLKKGGGIVMTRGWRHDSEDRDR